MLKEFVIKLGFDGAELDKGIKQSEQKLQKLASTMKNLIGGYFTYQAMSGIIRAYQDFNMQISNAQQLLGGNVSDLSAMARAMKRFGGDTNSVIGALKSMNSHLHQARFGGGALIEVAKKYGVAVYGYKSADKALLALAKQMQGYDRQTKLAIMSQLGLDEAMQRAFMDGGKELERQIAKQGALGVETEEDIKLSQEFNNSVLDMKDMFSALAREMLRGIMPLIRSFVDFLYKFIEALRKNRAFAIGFFTSLAILLSPIVLMFLKMAAASIAAFAPFYAIAAIVTIVVALIEDLYYYFMGWDSATGELVKKFPILKKIIEPLRPVIMGIVKLVQDVIKWFKDPSIENFKNIFTGLESTIKSVLDTISNAFGELFEWLGEKFPALKPLFDALASGFQNLKNLVSGLWQSTKDFFKALFDWNLDGMINAVKSAIDNILGFFGNAWDSVTSWFGFGNDSVSAPAVPVSAGNTANININNNLNQNFNTNASVGQIQNATQQGLTNSVISQRQALGNVYE